MFGQNSGNLLLVSLIFVLLLGIVFDFLPLELIPIQLFNFPLPLKLFLISFSFAASTVSMPCITTLRIETKIGLTLIYFLR